MPILIALFVVAIVCVRAVDDLSHAPWLSGSRLLLVLAVVQTIVGGIALGALAVASDAHNWLLFGFFLVATIPFWLGPRRTLELVLRRGPRSRLLYLSLWTSTVIHTTPPAPGDEPPAVWKYDQFMAELDSWSDARTKPCATLLADRTRDWRSNALMSPLDRVRRESMIGRWLTPDVVDPAATRRWQLYAAYWAAIADAGLADRRPVLDAGLRAFREGESAAFIDLVIGSLDKPLDAWPWEAIEASASAVWPDFYSFAQADLNAPIVQPVGHVPTLPGDWDRGHVIPLRPAQVSTTAEVT